MTRNSKRPQRNMGILKWAMALGSLTASFLGTTLLTREKMAPQTTVSPNPSAIVIDIPISMPTTTPIDIPEANPQTLSLDLAPIPKAVSPIIKEAPPRQIIQVAPVTQSRSSK